MNKVLKGLGIGVAVLAVLAIGQKVWFQKMRVEPRGNAALLRFRTAGLPAKLAPLGYDAWIEAVRTEDTDGAKAILEAVAPKKADEAAWSKKWDDVPKLVKSDDPAVRDAVKALFDDPAVAAMDRAGRAKTCALTGGAFPIADVVIETPLAPFLEVMDVTLVLIAKGSAMGEAGDKAGAERTLRSALSVGRHLENDYTLIAYAVGGTIQSQALGALAVFYKAAGDEEMAKQARDFLAQLEGRKDSLKVAASTLFEMTLSADGLAAVDSLLTSKDAPNGFKAEAVMALSMGHLLTFNGVVYGPESRRKKALAHAMESTDPVIKDIAQKSSKMVALSFGERKKLAQLASAIE